MKTRIPWRIVAKQAHKIISDELKRAQDRELELRWEPIREALAILEGKPKGR